MATKKRKAPVKNYGGLPVPAAMLELARRRKELYGIPVSRTIHDGLEYAVQNSSLWTKNFT